MKRQQKIDDILSSFDGIQRANARPFMYTRVMAKFQKEENNVWSRVSAFVARPIVALAMLIVVLAINYFIIKNDDAALDNNTVTTVSSFNSATDLLQSDNFISAVNNYESTSK
ncbi:MAG: hypothetical protein IPH58_06380 [Sphingobacteriales bacterium]|jgi:fucose permease|nr:hypothetical protein [Sphingobacteriales bacterium]